MSEEGVEQKYVKEAFDTNWVVPLGPNVNGFEVLKYFEINDLFNLTQEVNLHIFKLDDFEGLELTFDQMKAIMFMIEE